MWQREAILVQSEQLASDDSSNQEGDFLGVEGDDEGNRIYWFDFGGVHYGFGAPPGMDQGAPDDGDTTVEGLRRFHRGGLMRGDTDSPHH